MADIYSKIHVLINGTLLLEYSDVRISENAGLSQVVTVEKGLAGFSPGAATTSISIDSNIPRDRWEAYQSNLKSGVEVNFQATAGGKTLSTKATILTRDVNYGANSNAKVSISLQTGPVEWQ